MKGRSSSSYVIEHCGRDKNNENQQDEMTEKVNMSSSKSLTAFTYGLDTDLGIDDCHI